MTRRVGKKGKRQIFLRTTHEARRSLKRRIFKGNYLKAKPTEGADPFKRALGDITGAV